MVLDNPKIVKDPFQKKIVEGWEGWRGYVWTDVQMCAEPTQEELDVQIQSPVQVVLKPAEAPKKRKQKKAGRESAESQATPVSR